MTRLCKAMNAWVARCAICLLPGELWWQPTHIFVSVMGAEEAHLGQSHQESGYLPLDDDRRSAGSEEEETEEDRRLNRRECPKLKKYFALGAAVLLHSGKEITNLLESNDQEICLAEQFGGSSGGSDVRFVPVLATDFLEMVKQKPESIPNVRWTKRASKEFLSQRGDDELSIDEAGKLWSIDGAKKLRDELPLDAGECLTVQEAAFACTQAGTKSVDGEDDAPRRSVIGSATATRIIEAIRNHFPSFSVSDSCHDARDDTQTGGAADPSIVHGILIPPKSAPVTVPDDQA